MSVTQTQCTCGKEVEIRSGVDVIFTMRGDRLQAVYPEEVGKHYSIFRCKSCLEPLHQTVEQYHYIPYIERPQPPEQKRKQRR